MSLNEAGMFPFFLFEAGIVNEVCVPHCGFHYFANNLYRLSVEYILQNQICKISVVYLLGDHNLCCDVFLLQNSIEFQ